MSETGVYEDLTEEEAYLYAILQDESGLDQAEFSWVEMENDDMCFRCWPFQWSWWRNPSAQQIDQAGRSIGKSLSIKARAFAFPFIHSGEEMVITAPEGVHLDAITDVIETAYLNTRLGSEMLGKGRTGIKHRPFHMNFQNGSRIMGRIPQRDGKGMKGSVEKGTLLLTRDRGYVPVEGVQVGEFVWSHESCWTSVVDTYWFRQKNGFVAKSQGSFEVRVSSDHRWFAREDSSRQPGKTKRELSDNRWHWADSVPESKYVAVANSYLAVPNTFGNELPIPLPDFDGCKNSYEINDSFWWMIGRLIADAAIEESSISLFAHPKDQEVIGQKAKECGMNHFSVLARDHSSADRLLICNAGLARWFKDQFGQNSYTKSLPTWALTMKEEWRQALLGGYLSGDGCLHEHAGQDRWNISSASKTLTMGLGMLAHTLGWNIGFSESQNNVTEIMGVPLVNPSSTAYICRLTKSGNGVDGRDGFTYYKLKKLDPCPDEVEFYGVVTENHSYLSEGLISHNTHPIWLEMDEAQDYPDKGWVEVIETLKRGFTGARWRAHGVTRGVRDYFYKFTQEGSGWSVNRFCLPAGTQVYTTNGPISIEEIDIGAEVYCVDEHSPNELITDEVTAVVDNGIKEIWDVNIHGGYDLRSTGNHPYLVLQRSGTPRTRRELAFEWVEARDLREGDYVVCARNLPSSASQVAVNSDEILEMLGDFSPQRTVPEYIWKGSTDVMKTFLAGYLMGDGSRSRQEAGQDPFAINTSSWLMAKQLRAMCHYVGWRATSIIHDRRAGIGIGNTDMYRFYVYPEEAWYKQIPLAYSRVRDGEMLKGLDEHFVARKVLSSSSSGKFERTYDLTVGESHSFIAEGVVVHNTGMHRPTWSAEERETKIEQYGSRDHPDYRRNVLGLHGDATNPLFVLHRLMECLLGDTEISTPDGVRLIKDLREGDSVYNAFDESTVLAVSETLSDEIYEVVVDGESVFCTAEHPFFTGRGWVHADTLESGDEIYGREEILRMVRERDSLEEEQKVLLETLCADLAWTNLSWLGNEEEDG